MRSQKEYLECLAIERAIRMTEAVAAASPGRSWGAHVRSFERHVIGQLSTLKGEVRHETP